MKKAVLMIHGFAGGVYDAENLATFLELKGFHVFTFTLPGHERLLFNKVERQDWIDACEYQFKMLKQNGYTKIYVIGHSMGGVLATYLASKHKEVKKLILAAPAFKYMTFGEEDFKLSHALRNSPKLLKYYDKEELISRLIQFPRSVIKEFMSLVAESQDLPSKVKCPVLILHGLNDDIVPVESSKKIIKEFKAKDKKLLTYDNVTHDVFRSNEIENINNEVLKFLRKII